MNNPLNHGIRFGSGEFDSTHFKQCMVCHGDSLAGGRVPKKCNDCHSSAAVVVWVSKP
jgi:DnaJ-class molecular chaperone